MDKLAAHLIEKETITGKEFMEIFNQEMEQEPKDDVSFFQEDDELEVIGADEGMGEASPLEKASDSEEKEEPKNGPNLYKFWNSEEKSEEEDNHLQ